MTTTVAVLGLGAMGSRMCKRLLDVGFDVRVYNRTGARMRPLEDAGATGWKTPREAVAGADLVMSMVRDDEASAEVWLHPRTGALAGMERGTLAIECSTLSLGALAELGAAARVRGVHMMDGPVVGTRPQAEAGTLVFLVGGDPAQMERAAALFDATGAAVHHLGPLGRGMAMKLAVNALFGVQVAALAELLGALEGAGIEPSRAMEVLGSLAVCSPAAKGTGGLMVAGRFDPLFPVALVEKDFGYALDLAAAAGVDARVSAAARTIFGKAISAGYGDENLVAVAKLHLAAH